ncbi:MAG: hypothetical protein CMO80_22290 [Verrucomicrobiales bacterium]|nr:hypothetical protein [Verrucomicrobiales bacterium]|tara:strand:+ start:52615 stop:53250 length:636 start_codon:yes stop_codon:yes gene_type:complete
MLKFINENDFLKEGITFEQIALGVVKWQYPEGEKMHNGIIFEGFKRTAQVQSGTEQVQVGEQDVNLGTDKNPKFETVPVFEDLPKMETVEIDIWEKLLELDEKSLISVKWMKKEDHDAIAQEEQRASFKSERQYKLDRAVVTTTNGFKFDADERSITRMSNAISAAERAGRTDVRWSLADTATGVMTDITLQDLQEAHTLAVENMESIWEV